MRLINVRSLAMEEFYGDDIPPYAILSHTWGPGEIGYEAWQNHRRFYSYILSWFYKKPAGLAKIEGACRLARQYDVGWAWVDTKCIDKSSAAELTEAINSMFRWYARSRVCIVYLSDVPSAKVPSEDLKKSFRASRWFTRGWTLQELIAPEQVHFFAADWSSIGAKDDAWLQDEIFAITAIPRAVVSGKMPVSQASVSQRMSWVATRMTTRVEDMAYCMIGIFEVSMPFIYGEGMGAFERLQQEIIKISNDHTIFCWSWLPSVPPNWVSLLAPSPDVFVDGNLYDRNDYVFGYGSINGPYSMTNSGLSMKLPLLYSLTHRFLVLNASSRLGSETLQEIACIPVSSQERDDVLLVQRVPHPASPAIFSRLSCETLQTESLLAKVRPHPRESLVPFPTPPSDLPLTLLVTFSSVSLTKLISYADRPHDVGLVADVWRSLIRISQPLDKAKTVAGGLLSLNPQAVTSIPGRPYLFIAAKLVDGATQWYCQLLSAAHSDERWKTPHGRSTILEILLAQVSTAAEEQQTHFHRVLNLSAVIGEHPVKNYGDLKGVRMLYLRSGQAKYELKLNATGTVRRPVRSPEIGLFTTN